MKSINKIYLRHLSVASTKLLPGMPNSRELIFSTETESDSSNTR